MGTVSFSIGWYNGGHHTTIYDNDTETTILFSTEKISIKPIGTPNAFKDALKIKIGEFEKEYALGEITHINSNAAAGDIIGLVNQFRNIILD
jgi:hypothetical protein